MTGTPYGAPRSASCLFVAIWLALTASLIAAEQRPAAKEGKPPAAAEEKQPAAADEKPPVLKEDTDTPAELDVEKSELTCFQVEVPKDAVLMRVRLMRSPMPLDILARKGEPLKSAKDAENRCLPDSVENALLVSRQSQPPLETGTYYVAVGYLGGMQPVIHKRPVKKIPFTIRVSFVKAKVAGALKPGEKLTSQILADEGSVRTFVIDVPADAKALRIDLDEVSSDLDLLARYGEPILRNEDADDTAISALGRETLVIDPSSPKPLKPGRWYINVVHPFDYGTVDFTLYATFSPDPPPVLLAIPPLLCSDDGRKRAISATVEVATEWGAASGTLVAEDGLVLTNYHVVGEVAENSEEKDPVVVAVTFDPRQPPRELFRGKVLLFNKNVDLALVQITCGFYHQPLPPGYRFPALPLGDDRALEIGDTVSTLGFPSIGGSFGRVSVTLTRGVVSGFEKTANGTLMKTDAAISPGNSGGAALDAEWRLIGVPTSENVDPETVGRMSYIHPLSLIPEAWREMIRKRQSARCEPAPGADPTIRKVKP